MFISRMLYRSNIMLEMIHIMFEINNNGCKPAAVRLVEMTVKVKGEGA